jgi:hypothetical protein
MNAYLFFVLNHRIFCDVSVTVGLVSFVSTSFCPDALIHPDALTCADALSDPHEFYSWVKEIRKLNSARATIDFLRGRPPTSSLVGA